MNKTLKSEVESTLTEVLEELAKLSKTEGAKGLKDAYDELKGVCSDNGISPNPQYVADFNPVPALVDGKPIVRGHVYVGWAKETRPILVAADHEGKPRVDEHGNYAVIDPQNGQLRFKTKGVPAKQYSEGVEAPARTKLMPVASNAEALAYPDDNGLGLATSIVGGSIKDGSSLASSIVASATRPHELETRVVTRWGSVKLWAVAIVVFFAIRIRRLIKRWKNRRGGVRIPTPGPLVGIHKYLSPEAKKLSQTIINSSVYSPDRTGGISFRRCVAMRVPMDLRGYVLKEHLVRWGNFLNDLAANGTWKYGVFAVPGFMELSVFGLRRYGVLFAFIFTDQIPEDSSLDEGKTIAALNEKVGFPVFVKDGEAGSGDWSEFPW